MSAEETVLNLFEEYWFEQRVFASKPSLSDPFCGDKETVGNDEDQAAMNSMTTPLMRKSYSDQFLTARLSESESPSPKSVLGPHLQTILSGKEVESFDSSLPEEDRSQIPETVRVRRRRRKSGSRSLSELELEELKGFIDLGFVFSDEDRDSRLGSIIPGLQRLAKKVEEEGDETTSSWVSRPYLSEAWECVGEGETVKNPLMDWRIPSFGNEMKLKDNLKFWAHTVASTVR